MKYAQGKTPKGLKGRLSVSAEYSPWWEEAARRLTDTPGMVGRILTIDELRHLPELRYRDGNVPRGRTVVRRLHRILRLVQRGPNMSLGIGSTYEILPLQMAETNDWLNEEVDDDPIESDQEFLRKAILRMTREDQKRKKKT